MSKISTLVPWDSTTTEAILAQLQKRVDDAKEKGFEVGVATVVVVLKDNARYYETGISTMPVECAMWCSEKLRRAVLITQDES